LTLFYQKHIFLCTNQKAPGKVCCANTGGEVYFAYMKEQLIQKGLHGPNKVRLSQAKCLGRCSEGPCLVIYPEGVWYTYASFADLDAIIEQHVQHDACLEHLLMDVPGDLSG
jgi:(2Fe-2S) ferredoxin